MTPDDLSRTNASGNVPRETMSNSYGGVPPCAVNVNENAALVEPFGIVVAERYGMSEGVGDEVADGEGVGDDPGVGAGVGEGVGVGVGLGEDWNASLKIFALVRPLRSRTCTVKL